MNSFSFHSRSAAAAPDARCPTSDPKKAAALSMESASYSSGEMISIARRMSAVSCTRSSTSGAAAPANAANSVFSMSRCMSVPRSAAVSPLLAVSPRGGRCAFSGSKASTSGRSASDTSVRPEPPPCALASATPVSVAPIPTLPVPLSALLLPIALFSSVTEYFCLICISAWCGYSNESRSSASASRSGLLKDSAREYS